MTSQDIPLIIILWPKWTRRIELWRQNYDKIRHDAMMRNDRDIFLLAHLLRHKERKTYVTRHTPHAVKWMRGIGAPRTSHVCPVLMHAHLLRVTRNASPCVTRHTPSLYLFCFRPPLCMWERERHNMGGCGMWRHKRISPIGHTFALTFFWDGKRDLRRRAGGALHLFLCAC